MKVGDILIRLKSKSPAFKIIEVKNNTVTLKDLKDGFNFTVNKDMIYREIDNSVFIMNKQYEFQKQLEKIINENR